jgi:hypothetical protein
VAALETENKLLKEGSGLFICCNKCDVHWLQKKFLLFLLTLYIYIYKNKQ